MYKPFLFLLLCLVAAGCKTARQTTFTDHHATRSDSVIIREVVHLDTVRIPADSVIVHVPVTILKRDTVIRYRSERATATLQSRGGQITLTTRCESLEKLVVSYRRELIRTRQKNKTLRRESEKEYPAPWYYKVALWLALLYLLFQAIKALFQRYLTPSR